MNQVGDFLGGLRGLFGQLADFVGYDRKPEAMFAGARRFDGGVQREQVGLFGEVINDFDDLADVVGTMAENVDDFRGRLNSAVGAVQAIGSLLHGLNTGDDFLARAIGDVEKNFGGIGDSLNRSDHLIDGGGSFRNAGSLHLGVLDDVLHVDAHFVHGAGDFFDGGRGLDADLCGFIGGTSDLTGAGGNLRSAVARGADDCLQAVGHAHEGVAERVALRARCDFDGKVAFGNGHGDAGHFLQVRDHVVERGSECANFVVSVNINVLVEVARVADFLGDCDEVLQRLRDGLGGAYGFKEAEADGKDRTDDNNGEADSVGKGRRSF